MAPGPATSGISALLRNVRGGQVPFPPRPKGRLVWLHLPPTLPPGTLALLKASLEDFSILITHSEAAVGEGLVQPLPSPRRTSIDQFIAHWQPELLLWGAPENGLAITRRGKRAGLNMLLADTGGHKLAPALRGRQLTEFLAHFERVFVEDPDEIVRFKKHDLEEKKLVPCKPLSEIAAPMPGNDPLLRRISGAIGPRPVWCAACVSRGEVDALLAAHRFAIRANPNLMLIIVPRAASDVIEAKIATDGWRMAPANQQARPEPHVEVLLAQNCDDLAVWMRLASVTYMGGTLYGPEAADPFAAVALGSAVLCGPMHAPFEARYQRLNAANGLVEVEAKSTLPAKLVEMLAPDASALLAMQAWNVGSEGAEAVQILTREINALLDRGAD